MFYILPFFQSISGSWEMRNSHSWLIETQWTSLFMPQLFRKERERETWIISQSDMTFHLQHRDGGLQTTPALQHEDQTDVKSELITKCQYPTPFSTTKKAFLTNVFWLYSNRHVQRKTRFSLAPNHFFGRGLMQAFCLFSESKCLTQTNQSSGCWDESLQSHQGTCKSSSEHPASTTALTGHGIEYHHIAISDGWAWEVNNTE